MPRRRRLGRAFGALGEAGVGAFGALLRHEFQKQLQKEYLERQLEVQRQGFEQELFTEAAKNPALALRLSRAGMKQFAPLSPSDAEMSAEVASTISGAKDLSALPSTEDVLNLRRTAGPIEDLASFTSLVNQRHAKAEQLGGLEPTTEITRFDDTERRNVREHIPNSFLRNVGPYPTEPTPDMTLEEARRTEAMKDSFEEHNQLFPGLGPGGAPGVFSVDTERGTYQQVPDLAPIPRAGQDTAGDRANSAAALLNRFKELADQVNTGEGFDQFTEGATRWGKQLFNLDNTAQEFQRLRSPLGVMLAVIAQGARPAETEQRAFIDLLPSLRTPKTVAKNLLRNIDAVIARAGVQGMTTEEIAAAMEAGELQPLGFEEVMNLLTTETPDDATILQLLEAARNRPPQ